MGGLMMVDSKIFDYEFGGMKCFVVLVDVDLFLLGV